MRIKSALTDFWRDGYKVFGLAAPLVSLAFTLAKALEVPVNLRDYSYAWALLPIVVWLGVAYARRWLSSAEVQRTLDALTNGGRNVRLLNAIYFKATGAWPESDDHQGFFQQRPGESNDAWDERVYTSGLYNSLVEQLPWFRQQLADGHLDAWGKQNTEEAVMGILGKPIVEQVLIPVPKSHWVSHEIDRESLIHFADYCMSAIRPGELDSEAFMALQTNRKQVEFWVGQETKIVARQTPKP